MEPISTPGEIERLRQELENSRTEADILMSAALLLNTTLELKSLLKIILEQSARIVNAEASSLALVAEDGRELIFVVSVGTTSELIEQIRIPFGKGVIGWVVEHGREVRVDDCSKDPRFYADVDKRTSFVTRSILALPLRTKRGVIGGIEVLNKRGGQAFSDGDARILAGLASQAALAIENAKLYESMLEEKNRIAAIVNSIADGILVTDRFGRVELANPSARAIWDLDRPETAAKLDVVLAEILRAGGDRAFDLALMKPENLILSSRAGSLRDASGEVAGHVVSMRNVTEAKGRENARLEFVNLLAVKLVERMERFLETGRGEPAALRAVAEFYRTVKKFTYFIDVISGPLRLNRFSYPVGPIAECALARVDAAAREKPVRIDAKVEPFDLDTDEDRLADCLEIVLDNAIRFTPSGGVVSLEVTRDEERARIVVADPGIGMSREAVDALLDKARFLERPGESGEGSLGLLYVQHVVEAFSGRFRMTSGIGVGTRVEFDLPLAIV